LPIPKQNEYNSDNLPNEITIITAYFDLGSFKKGKFKTFSSDMYLEWMKSYSKINNTVIAFTDSEEVEKLMKEIRKDQPKERSKVILVERNSLWAFKLAPKIKEIFAQPWYPTYSPNTVNELYPCAMHVKYELIQRVIKEKLCKTKYLSWIDVGYFRSKEKTFFMLDPPQDLKDDHIAFLQIHQFYPDFEPFDIIDRNLVWVAGGIFIGRPEYLMVFIEDYKNAVKWLMEKKLMSTDQQVLYSMYTKINNLYPRIPLQFYYHNCHCDWFFLGALCRYTWERRQKKSLSLSYFANIPL